MKAPLAELRKKGYLVSSFIDDLINLGDSYEECVSNVIHTRRATTGGSWGSRPLPFFSKERKCPFSREIRNFRLEMNCFNIDLNTEISGC